MSLALIATPAIAQDGPPCGPRKALIQNLERVYEEARSGFGTINNKVLFEVWVSEKGTWTLLATSPDGNSCIMAAGQNWQDAKGPAGNPI